MGTQRIVIDQFNDHETAVKHGQAALAAAREAGCSPLAATVTHHPGESDETTTDLLTQ